MARPRMGFPSWKIGLLPAARVHDYSDPQPFICPRREIWAVRFGIQPLTQHNRHSLTPIYFVRNLQRHLKYRKPTGYDIAIFHLLLQFLLEEYYLNVFCSALHRR